MAKKLFGIEMIGPNLFVLTAEDGRPFPADGPGASKSKPLAIGSPAEITAFIKDQLHQTSGR